MKHSDVCIAGAGLIGATLALELAARGLHVALLTDTEPLAHASTAAAGMLAVDDPENPPALYPLSVLSRDLYVGFLADLADLGGQTVRFQTHHALQSLNSCLRSRLTSLSPADLRALLPQLDPGAHNFAALNETSLDPRELARAVRSAVDASTVDLHHNARVHSVREHSSAVTVTSTAVTVTAALFVDCTGAWTLPGGGPTLIPVQPRKGQLLTITLPSSLPLEFVLRTHAIYIVPRLHGAQAGRAVIGATVEDRGFDTSIDPRAINALRTAAAQLLPALADAPIAETWAGLRPATADGLPVLGATGTRTFIAKGHYRNGILLAPATARVMTQLLLGEQTSVDFAAFSPQRILQPQP